MADLPKAFIIMPYDDEFDAVYTHVIRPALKEAGYQVARADTKLDQQNILRDIVEGIHGAKLIVADLTALNANVMYELGLAHGLGTPTVMITQALDTTPFDLRQYRIHTYSPVVGKADELGQKLREIAGQHRSGQVRFGSPVSDFHPTASLPSPEPARQPTNGASPEAGEEPGEPGLLDLLVEGHQASERMTAVLTDLARQTENLGCQVQDHTESAARAQAQGGPGLSARLFKIALELSRHMDGYSGAVENALPELEQQVDAFFRATTALPDWVKSESEEDRRALAQLRSAVEPLLTASRESHQSLGTFRDAVSNLKTLRISRDVTRSSNRMSRAVEGVMSVAQQVEAGCVRALAVIDVKLGPPPGYDEQLPGARV